jgi:hypothetical protein
LIDSRFHCVCSFGMLGSLAGFAWRFAGVQAPCQSWRLRYLNAPEDAPV